MPDKIHISEDNNKNWRLLYLQYFGIKTLVQKNAAKPFHNTISIPALHFIYIYTVLISAYYNAILIIWYHFLL
jgi:hypothetical protein